jgi:DNA (cytosine-5)-methyltransferase 1
MKHGSLFSGIGGFDLASEWMGWENVFHCEWMEFPRKVLDYYWPNADSHIDICNTNFKKYANKIDILTGGFPCQPFSMAGKRKGTDDERYLWGEMLRAVQEIKPKFVIAENVFGITNIDGGLVFEQVCLDLETQGYEVQSFIIPAAAKNAPHRRDRCWFIGVRNATDNNGIIRREGGESKPRKQSRHGKSNEGCDTQINGIATNSNCNDGRSTDRKGGCEKSKTTGEGQQSIHSRIRSTSHEGNASDTNSTRLHKSNVSTKSIKSGSRCRAFDEARNFSGFPTQPPICGGDDGLPTELDGITFSKWRAESIKGYGNAIVPQVALELFKVIEKINCNLSK